MPLDEFIAEVMQILQTEPHQPFRAASSQFGSPNSDFDNCIAPPLRRRSRPRAVQSILPAVQRPDSQVRHRGRAPLMTEYRR